MRFLGFCWTVIKGLAVSSFMFWTTIWALYKVLPELATMEPASPVGIGSAWAVEPVSDVLHLGMKYPDGALFANLLVVLFWIFVWQKPLDNEKKTARELAAGLRKDE